MTKLKQFTHYSQQIMDLLFFHLTIYFVNLKWHDSYLLTNPSETIRPFELR